MKHFNGERQGKTMEPKRLLRPWQICAVILCVIVVVLAIWLVNFLRGKPLVTITERDFINLSKPLDYEPDQDAAPSYLRVAKEFHEPLDLLYTKPLRWPSNLDANELKIVHNWLTEKSEPLELIRRAALKPYCWIEGHDQSVECELGLVGIGKVLCWRSIFRAYKGDYKAAAADLIVCHKIGRQLQGPSWIGEQLAGLVIRASAIDAAFVILACDPQDERPLQLFEKYFREIGQATPKVFDLQYEKLFCTYQIQRAFTENGKGDGHLLPSIRYVATYHVRPDGSKIAEWRYEPRLQDYTPTNIWYAATGPRKKETLQLLDKCFVHLQKVASTSPWETHIEAAKGLKELQRQMGENKFLASTPWNGSHIELIRRAHRIRTKEFGFIATLKILRYESDRGQFPTALQELVTTGYTKELPIDPYSDKPFVYKRADDSFTLYSLGSDFEDNGGEPIKWDQYEPSGDIVFWPVERPKPERTPLTRRARRVK